MTITTSALPPPTPEQTAAAIARAFNRWADLQPLREQLQRAQDEALAREIWR